MWFYCLGLNSVLHRGARNAAASYRSFMRWHVCTAMSPFLFETFLQVEREGEACFQHHCRLQSFHCLHGKRQSEAVHFIRVPLTSLWKYAGDSQGHGSCIARSGKSLSYTESEQRVYLSTVHSYRGATDHKRKSLNSSSLPCSTKEMCSYFIGFGSCSTWYSSYIQRPIYSVAFLLREQGNWLIGGNFKRPRLKHLLK